MIIDVNASLGPFAFRRLRHNTPGALLKLMDSHGIDRAIVSSTPAITYRNAQAGNEELSEDVGHHRDRLIPFAVLNPTYAGWRDDLRICREEFGMRGVKLHPRWHGFTLSDPRCHELVQAATELGLLVAIAIRVEDPRERSWLVDVPDVPLDEVAALLKAFPKGRFLIMNGIGFRNSPLGKKASGLPENYVIEISRLTALIEDELGALVQNLGADRLVLGTGMPFNYPDPALLKLQVMSSGDEIRQQIAWKNIARWLG